MKDSSFICPDYDGSLLAKYKDKLKKDGYDVRVINPMNPEVSDCINPFTYMHQLTDIERLADYLIKYTDACVKEREDVDFIDDMFWKRTEEMYLKSLLYYTCMEMPEEKRNLGTVISLLKETYPSPKDPHKQSEYDKRMTRLREQGGDNHPAFKSYADAVRVSNRVFLQIVSLVEKRLEFLENSKDMLSKDSFSLAKLGMGTKDDKKTALFCVIGNEESRIIANLTHVLLFSELMFQVYTNCDGKLPIPVSFIMDVQSNITMPDDFYMWIPCAVKAGISTTAI